MSNSTKLWSKGYEADRLVETFTVGNDRLLDLRLAKYDVIGSLAHIRMLESIGLLTSDELTLLVKGLEKIQQSIENGEFVIEEGVEDVHSQVELLLTRLLGEVGKKIHSGRSRNDQILVDLKLYLRDAIKSISGNVNQLFEQLIVLSEQYKNILMPGYTHLQIAMPSSFGLWFGAYAESLADDMLLMEAAYRLANQNPLGTAAGYGSSFPLNRTLTTELLGFDTMHYNAIAAQMSRGKTERSLSYAMSAIASTVARLSMDVCLYMGQNFSFISFPDELTTGSSIMPHKKNPDVFELIRAKCNRLQSIPNEIGMLMGNLPAGYHRDYQLLKEIIFPAIDELQNCLHMATFMLQHVKVNKDILNDERYNYLFTVEDVNQLVVDGVPFREAYRTIGEQVQNGTYKPSKNVSHTHEGSIGNLCNVQIQQKMRNVLSAIGIKE